MSVLIRTILFADDACLYEIKMHISLFLAGIEPMRIPRRVMEVHPGGAHPTTRTIGRTFHRLSLLLVNEGG